MTINERMPRVDCLRNENGKWQMMNARQGSEHQNRFRTTDPNNRKMKEKRNQNSINDGVRCTFARTMCKKIK